MPLLEQALAVLLGLIGIGAALAVVTGKDLFKATLFFGVFLIAVAGVYLALDASFVAVMQVFVYVGGVVVMVLFGIMLTEKSRFKVDIPADKRLAAGAPIVVLVAVLIGAALTSTFRTTGVLSEVTIGSLGKLFVNEYALPFELVSVLLLAALVGAIAVAKGRDD